jgi:hypothetical protein
VKPRNMNALSRKWLTERGFEVDGTQYFNYFSKQFRDLFGFCDMAAYKPGAGFCLIQSTSGTNHAARRDKIMENKHALGLLRAGGVRIYLHSWSKHAGERSWTLRAEEIVLEGDQLVAREVAGA